MKHQIKQPYKFLLRWFVSSLGLFVAAGLLGNHINYGGHIGIVITAGLILAIINTILKPILVILTLPALIFSLGLFMIIINGITVYIASKLYMSLHITSFWSAVFAGMVIGLVNYLVTTVVEDIETK